MVIKYLCINLYNNNINLKISLWSPYLKTDTKIHYIHIFIDRKLESCWLEETVKFCQNRPLVLFFN